MIFLFKDFLSIYLLLGIFSWFFLIYSVFTKENIEYLTNDTETNSKKDNQDDDDTPFSDLINKIASCIATVFFSYLLLPFVSLLWPIFLTVTVFCVEFNIFKNITKSKE